MTGPLGVEDFFVLEAGEYLERLSHLVAASPAAPDDLVRFTRALRGSALMARQQPIARAAGGLEALVRAFRDGRRQWDQATASISAEAVAEIRILVLAVREWTEELTARADRLATALESEAGGVTDNAARAARNVPADAGVRAFIAREGAVVASALDQASRALRSAPDGRDTLQAVLRRMQPLRGLAALVDFPPLPELLDGIARVIADMPQLTLSRDASGELFDAAAKAVARAARDVAEHGRPDGESAEARHFATLLLATRPAEPVTVPIESLFFEDSEPGIVRRGTPPDAAPGATLGEAELVSRGEHLCQIADDLEGASSPTQRDLRLHALTGDLRALAPGTTGDLNGCLLEFSDVAAGMLEEGLAARIAHAFAERLRAVGEALRAAPQSSDQETTERVREATAGLRRLKTGSISASVPAIAQTAGQTTIEAMELDIVPIESLAPDDDAPAVLSTGLAPDLGAAALPPTEFASLFKGSGSAEESRDLAGTFVTFGRLMDLSTGSAPSIDGLLGRLHAAPAPRPVTRATPVTAAPLPAPMVEVSVPVVEIAELCYRGRTALQRAALVKMEIERAIEASSFQASLQPLVAELLDLVELALIE